MSDQTADAGAVSASDVLAKAADPQKAIQLLQQLRNDAETSGDADAADAYTDAIRQVMVGAGMIPPFPDGDDDADDMGADDDGSDGTDDVTQAAQPTDVRKIGASMSAANMALAQQAHDALHKMTGGAVCAGGAAPGGAGAVAPDMMAKDPNAVQMAQSLAPDAFAKALAPALEGIAKVLERQGVEMQTLKDQLSRLPAPGAPAMRAVEKVLPGSTPAATQPAIDLEEAELNALRKVRDSATDDITRKALADEITKREIASVYRRKG